jgi:hypothetical protein
MIRTLRAFFLGRLLREKLLLVAFIAVGALIWLSGFSARAGQFWRAERSTTTELKLQDEWLRNEVRIQEAATQATAQFDASRTLDGNRLFTKVQALARDAGLRNISNQGVQQGVTNGQFSVNTLQLQVSNADWEAIKRFYLLLNQNAPYVAIDQFTLTPVASNPTQLTLTLKVKSFEMPR